jgi:hypothetical protein
MSINRPSTTVRCAGCSQTPKDQPGSGNFRMCDTCFVTYCSTCFDKIRYNPTSCSDHVPFGKWLRGGDTGGGTTTFS